MPAFDELWNGLADAVADVREKVVEEPMWGRVVNERESSTPQWPEAKEAESEQAFGSHVQELERERNAPDHDIER